MKYMLIAELVIPDSVKMLQVRDYLKAQIALHPIWKERFDEEAVTINRTEEGIEVGIRLWVRFDLIASRDDIFQKAKSWLQNNPEVTGSIRYHPCGHDEGLPVPCIETVLWSRE